MTVHVCTLEGEGKDILMLHSKFEATRWREASLGYIHKTLPQKTRWREASLGYINKTPSSEKQDGYRSYPGGLGSPPVVHWKVVFLAESIMNSNLAPLSDRKSGPLCTGLCCKVVRSGWRQLALQI